MKTRLRRHWNFEDGLPIELKFLDIQKAGGFHGVSQEAAYRGKYSLKQVLQGINSWHHVASFFYLPYVDINKFTLESYFLVPDIRDFTAPIEFAMEKFTGTSRNELGVQYRRPSLANGAWMIWRAYEGGTGKYKIGDWEWLDDGQQDLESNVWHHLILKGRLAGLGKDRPAYDSLQVDGRIWDLSGYDAGMTPKDDPSAQWEPHLIVNMASTLYSDHSESVYYDDVSLVAPTFDWNLLALGGVIAAFIVGSILIVVRRK